MMMQIKEGDDEEEDMKVTEGEGGKEGMGSN